ncbi:nucleotide exchange factor GrpE [Bordetella genomosp. 10]|uniref:Protein GrpE n=1 Tax=Bordetella genomosp. 10 TaxID=1416804 RepID=A0A261S1V3_9BORD|nr:nucleotide exchange factor GrpE [Bordetella genomosp. 10]OZI30922.1 nucleotide exchange factor GrpE [Bordetella genomosp. 10]
MTAQNEPADKGPEIDPASQAPASGDAAAPADPLLALQAQLAEAQAKATEHYDQLLRTRAEAENIRRRAQEDVSKAHKFGIESFAESLVPVKDSLEAALAQQEQTLEIMREGVESTLKQLSSAFERNRLIEIAPAAGEKFDPHQHQAISSVPSDQPANTVVQTLQKGYLIADRVLRPALVMVSAGQG